MARNGEVTFIRISSGVRDLEFGELGFDSVFNFFPVYFICGVLGVGSLEVDNYSIIVKMISLIYFCLRVLEVW